MNYEIDEWIFEESNQINFDYLIDPDDGAEGEEWASLKVTKKWF